MLADVVSRLRFELGNGRALSNARAEREREESLRAALQMLTERLGPQGRSREDLPA